MWYTDFLKAIRAGQAPMAVVPPGIVQAMLRREQLAEEAERKYRRALWICLAFALAGFAAWIFVMVAYDSLQPLRLAILIAVIVACCCPAFLLKFVKAGSDYEGVTAYDKENLDCILDLKLQECGVKSLHDFAVQLSILVDCLGEESANMGEWKLEDIQIHSYVILRKQAKKVKSLQAPGAKDGDTAIAAKTDFKKIHKVFERWGLNPGPHDPYFKD